MRERLEQKKQELIKTRDEYLQISFATGDDFRKDIKCIHEQLAFIEELLRDEK
jgi:hypothetical protein